jgi:hypothetical protein
MDERFTYSSRDRVHLMVYVAPGYEPPDTLTLTRDGAPVEFLRLSDRSLECGRVATRINAQGEEVPVPGECTAYDCHRAVLGECQCGRHPSPVRFERAR